LSKDCKFNLKQGLDFSTNKNVYCAIFINGKSVKRLRVTLIEKSKCITVQVEPPLWKFSVSGKTCQIIFIDNQNKESPKM